MHAKPQIIGPSARLAAAMLLVITAACRTAPPQVGTSASATSTSALPPRATATGGNVISPAERLSQMQAHLQAMQVRVNRMGDRPSREEIQAMLDDMRAMMT